MSQASEMCGCKERYQDDDEVYSAMSEIVIIFIPVAIVKTSRT